MRVLLVSATFPHDPPRMDHGVYKRLRMLVDGIAGLGSVELLFFVAPRIDTSPEATREYRRRLADYWGVDFDLKLVNTESPPEHPTRRDMYMAGLLDCFRQWNFRWASGHRQRAALDEALARQPDVLVVHRLTPMAPVLSTDSRLPPLVFDLDDVEHVALARDIPQPPTWPGKRLSYLKLPALWWGERRAIRLARRTFVCSERDRSYLARTMRVSGVVVVPNAVDVRDPLPLTSRHSALFLGSLGYRPNRNAATHLVRDIWPRVRRAVPDAHLTIAGPHPERVPGYGDGHAGVEFTGFVPDLDELYARARVVCVPILSGGGTRIKLLEAAAYGKPIVATPIGAEGLELEDGRHLLVRRDSNSFAAAVVDLLTDDARCRELGLAAHEAVRTSYARNRVVERIRQVVISSLA